MEELTPAVRNGKIAKNFPQDGNATINKRTESQTQIKAKGCRIIASQKSGDAKSKKIEIDIERARNKAEEIS